MKTLDAIEAGAAPRTPQNHSEATFTTMITKDLCPIDWNRRPREIVKHVCGLSPWPTATAELDGQTMKIHKVEIAAQKTSAAPGTVIAAGKQGITVACADGAVTITELQAPGKKRMRAADWLLGHPLSVG